MILRNWFVPSRFRFWAMAAFLSSAFLSGLLGGFLAASFRVRSSSVFVTNDDPTVFRSGRREFYKDLRPTPELMADLRRSLIFGVQPQGKELTNFTDRVAVGISLTSDGLVAFPRPVTFSWVENSERELLALNVKDVEKRFFEDLTWSLLWLPEQGRRPVSFGSWEERQIGESLLAFDAQGGLRFVRITEVFAPTALSAPESSEKLSTFMRLEETLSLGTLLFTGEGELAGVVKDKTGLVLSGEIIKQWLRLLEKDAQPVWLGINFINLGSQAHLRTKDLAREGLLLAGHPGFPAVIPGSPAQQAGLRQGDRLLALEGRRISTSAPPLQLILRRYNPGAEVVFMFERGGQEKTVKVKLESP